MNFPKWCRAWMRVWLMAAWVALAAGAARGEEKAHYPALFERAAAEFGVPADVLKGVAFAETRWSHLTWVPGDVAACNGMPRPYGIMSLWDNEFFGHSLRAAAALIGETPEVLQEDARQNIRGAAALLKKLHAEQPLPEGTTRRDLESWRNAVAVYCGLPQEELAQQHALEVFGHITRGYHRHGIKWPARPVNLGPMREAVEQIKKQKQGRGAAAASVPSPLAPAAGAVIVPAATPDYPNAIWRPAYPGHWYTSGNGRYFVVIHDMEGYYLSTISYFQQAGTQASAHYCVNGLKDYASDAAPGEITQMVEERFWAWHARCLNTWSLGIEHEGFVANPAWYTEEQYQASALLTRYLCDKYGIPKDRNHIIGHNEHLNATWRAWMAVNFPSIDPLCNDHSDPGANWAWAHYLDLVIGATPPVITTQPTNQVRTAGETATFTVAVGGTNATGYQWRKNGVNVFNGGKISGVTSTTLTLTNVQLAEAGFYTVLVTNAGGQVVSDAAQLIFAATPIAAGTGTGLRAHVFDNADFTSMKRARIDATINFDWGTNSPSSTTDADTFSVRWTGQVQPRYTQIYRFHTRTDDGVRLWVNGVLLIDKFSDQGATEWSGTMSLTAGQKYDLRLDYYENTGTAVAQLFWSSASQVKEIIPQTQLYRPSPALAAPGNKTVTEGATLSFTVTATNADPWLSSQPVADFEDFADGQNSVMFRYPGFSGSTDQFLDLAETNYASVVAAFPAGNASARALKAQWAFATNAVNPWLRLTTASAPSLPNPTIDFTQSLWFDLHTDRPLKLAVGVRETGTAAAVGADGTTTGTIEFAGVSGAPGGTPNPTRALATGAWTTVRFDLPREPAAAFTGNGVIQTTNNKGTLEHLAFVPDDGPGVYRVYLDNFLVVQSNRLGFTLDPNAPAGAGLDPNTGQFTWTPDETQGPGVYSVRVIVTDGGAPALSATNTFVITVNESNRPPVLAALSNQVLHAGTALALTNHATDPDWPANLLAFTLDPGAPVGVLLEAGTGVLTWIVPEVFSALTNTLTVRVTDNGTPSRSDAKTFTVAVLPRPRATVQWTGGAVTLSWSAIAGRRYRVQSKPTLDAAAWMDLGGLVTASGPSATASDSTLGEETQRFYRIVVVQ